MKFLKYLIPFKFILNGFYIGKIQTPAVKYVFIVIFAMCISACSWMFFDYYLSNSLNKSLLPSMPKVWELGWVGLGLYRIMIPITWLFVIYIFLSIISLLYFKLTKEDLSDEFIISEVNVVLLTMIFAAPALYYVYIEVLMFFKSICTGVLICNLFTQHFLSINTTSIIIFVPMFYIINRKLWPIYLIERDLPFFIAPLVTSIVNSLYYTCILYIATFFILKIKIVDTNKYFQYLWDSNFYIYKIIEYYAIIYYNHIASFLQSM